MTDTIQLADAETTGSLRSGTYALDTAHTRIGFVARHAMITKVRGQFDEFEGSASIDVDNPAASSVSVTIQVASIDTHNAQRDGHLRTNDFFEVDTYPTITFASTSVERDGDVWHVTGDLTIKATTKPVTIDFEFTGAATDPFGNARVGFEGSTTVKRSDFGVTWNAPLDTGGVLVSEKVTLEFEISAVKQA